MNPHKQEQDFLYRCKAVVTGELKSACSQVEASLFHQAAMVLETQHSNSAKKLWEAGDAWLKVHHQKALEPPHLIVQGYLVSLPRWRNMLTKQLGQKTLYDPEYRRS